MGKKLQHKFIFISMLALLAILLLLFGGINIANYFVAVKSQDSLLHSIASGEHEPSADNSAPPPALMFYQEMESASHFFVVTLDENGEITDTFLDFVVTVSEEDAKALSLAVQKKGRTSGYYKDYRYYVVRNGDTTVQYFLNCFGQIQFGKTLLILSFLISLLCLAVLFLLVFFLSKKAISPFVKNIEAQKQFITDAGHELKTPLTSISTSADILALNDSDNEWIKNIQNQTQKLSRLVYNLVTMLRLDEETPVPEKTEFALSEALWESTEPYLSIARATGKNFEERIEDNMTYYGDVVTIQKMFSVLLDNALTYSNEGGRIRVDAYRKKKKIIIKFSNTCDPIDTKSLNRLFERFYRADPSRSSKTGGTGVGLSIAKAIARAHGGDITVKSETGTSICFTVKL